MTRLLATMRRDITLQVRYGLYAVSVFIVLVWGVLLGLLPGAARADAAVVVPALLAANLVVTTFYFMAGLVLLEKNEGTLPALVATPLRDSEYLLSKLLTLTALAVAESLLVVALLFGTRFRWDLLIAGAALLGALYVLAGFLAVIRYDSINEWLFPSAVVVTALLIPLLPHFGLTRHGFYLHPVTPRPPAPAGSLQPGAGGGMGDRLRGAGLSVLAGDGVRVGAAELRPLRHPERWRVMDLSSFYRSQVSVDLRNVRRDDMLVWVAAAPLFLALAFRFGLPPLSRLLDRELGFDLAPYHGLLMSFFVLMAPTMVGWVIGFLLLDERDEGTLTALLVTPMPLAGYLLYRTAVPLLLGFLVTVAGYPLAGLAPLPFPDLIAISLVASLNGPANSLFLAALAENKIAGLTLVKVLNTLAMIPIAAFFIMSPWQAVAGIMPTYWPMKMTWLAAAGQDYAWYVLPGIAVYGIVMLLLLRRFTRRLHL